MKKLITTVILVFAFTLLMISTSSTLSQEPEHKDQSSAEDKMTTDSLPSATVLGQRFRDRLRETDQLDIIASIHVAFLSVPLFDDSPSPTRDVLKALSDDDTTSSVDIRVIANMTPEELDVVMWKNGRSQPTMELYLQPDNNKTAKMTERHWYPTIGQYRTATYEASSPAGIEEYKIQPSLYTEIDTQVCAGADFMMTWLHDESSQADTFQEIIALGTSIAEDDHNGIPTYKVLRICYELVDEEDGSYNKREDIFWLDKKTSMLVGWDQLYANIRNGSHAAYKYVSTSYQYRLDPTVQ